MHLLIPPLVCESCLFFVLLAGSVKDQTTNKLLEWMTHRPIDPTRVLSLQILGSLLIFAKSKAPRLSIRLTLDV
ncbi:hypothetical protein B0H14DRAFT_104972 [Mycena olivaceomarginata]|nr:hypothetical protein B0H14DRAFT_104972 [Mycena olivaceomarginata]